MNEEAKIVRVLYDGGEGGEGAGDGAGDGGGNGGGAEETQLAEGAIYADQRFIEALPDDLKSNTGLAKITSVEHLARSWASSQKMIGKDIDKLVEMPSADDADGRRGVLTRLGLPENAEGYGNLDAVEGAPEYMAPSGALAKPYLEAAHNLGLLPEQAKGLYSWFAGVMKDAQVELDTNAKVASDENVHALQGELGAAFDQTVAAANFAIEKVGGAELRTLLQEAGLGTHPVVVKGFANAGKIFGEDGIGDMRGSGDNPFSGAMAPAEARAKALDLQEQAMKSSDQRERRRLNEEAQKFWKLAKPSAA